MVSFWLGDGPVEWRCVVYHEPMNHEQAIDALRALVDRYRAQCLWFLRDDYYPETPEDVRRVFRLIEEHGDLQAFRLVSASGPVSWRPQSRAMAGR